MTIGYQGDAELKEKFLANLRWHAEQDRIVRGSYGSLLQGRWKGCAIACSYRSVVAIEEGIDLGTEFLGKERGNANTLDFGAHKALACFLGIPVELCYLEDYLFESSDVSGIRDAWPLRVGSAIPVGADTSKAMDRIVLAILTDRYWNGYSDVALVDAHPGSELNAFYRTVVAYLEARLLGDDNEELRAAVTTKREELRPITGIENYDFVTAMRVIVPNDVLIPRPQLVEGLARVVTKRDQERVQALMDLVVKTLEGCATT